jgi:hypothetical protein
MSKRRTDWPISAKTEQAALAFLVDVATGVTKPGDRPRTARERIMAAKVIASFKQIALKREALQLRRELIHGRPSEVSLAEIVGEAEERAEVRKHERE